MGGDAAPEERAASRAGSSTAGLGGGGLDTTDDDSLQLPSGQVAVAVTMAAVTGVVQGGRRRRGSAITDGARARLAVSDAVGGAGPDGAPTTAVSASGKPPRARRSSDMALRGGAGSGVPASGDGVDLPPDPADEAGDDDDADSDSLASSMDSGDGGDDDEGLGAAAKSGVRLAASNAPARAAALLAAGTEMAQRLFGAGIENAGKPSLLRAPSIRLGANYSPVKVPWTPRTWSCADDPLSLRGVGVARLPAAQGSGDSESSGACRVLPRLMSDRRSAAASSPLLQVGSESSTRTCAT